MPGTGGGEAGALGGLDASARQQVHVGPRAEPAPCSGDDHGPHRRRVRGLLEQIEVPALHRRGPGVEPFRSVEGEGGHPVNLVPEHHVLVSHGPTLRVPERSDQARLVVVLVPGLVVVVASVAAGLRVVVVATGLAEVVVVAPRPPAAAVVLERPERVVVPVRPAALLRRSRDPRPRARWCSPGAARR